MNQLVASKAPILYDIKLLAKQLLGTVLDIEVDQSGMEADQILQSNFSFFSANFYDEKR